MLVAGIFPANVRVKKSLEPDTTGLLCTKMLTIMLVWRFAALR